MYVYWLDILGTIAFAISGVILAGKIKMDPFGVLVLGMVTAIGGGTMRDVILNNGPIFWVEDSTDAIVAIVTCFMTLLLIRRPNKLPKWVLPVLDAIGLAVFVGIGVNRAIAADVNVLVCVFMGVLTGVGGGVLRDVLAREIPLIFRTEVYATACMAGGLVHIGSYTWFAIPLEHAMILGMMVTLTIRLAAIRWNLKLPTFTLIS